MPSVPDALANAFSGRYRLDHQVGAGGMATVYAAEDLKHGRPVAIKVLRAELAAVLGTDRFLGEIDIVARLRHPHILPLYDSGEAHGFLYYVMPLVEGESLRDRLDRETQLPIETAVRIAREVADALSYAHDADVVHRDVKPENILLESGHAVVADFGIARAIDAAGGEKLTQTGLALGTPAYMSPEQASGAERLDGRSDVYALGCVLHEMLAGQPPFTGPTVDSIVHQHLALEPVSVAALRPAVPAAVASAIARALAKIPADRFPTAREFEAALTGPGATPPAPPGPRRRRRIGTLGLAGVSLLIAAAVWVLWPDSGDRGPTSSAAVGDAQTSPVIAVLPFANLSGIQENEYFSDGMAEDILTQLSRIGTLRVISRQSVMQYKGTAKSMREIADELGASHVVEGSVRRAANTVRITVQLIDARGDRHLWADQFDRELSAEALFGIQSDIAREIARELEATLSPAAERLATRPPTYDLTAYDYYLQGNERARGGTREDLERAIALYRQAIAQDSGYALAWAAMGFGYTAMVGATGAPLSFMDSAEVAARRALELDPQAPESHSVLALVYWNSGRLPQAVESYRRALDLRPNDPSTLWGLGFAVWHRGELDEALRLVRRAVTVDPASSRAYPLLGRCYVALGEFAEAESAFRRALQLKPDDTWAHEDLIALYLAEGDLEKAEAQLQTFRTLRPGSPEVLSNRGLMAVWRGDYREATATLEQAVATYPDYQFLPLADLGYAYAKLGDRVRAAEVWRRQTARDEAEASEEGGLFWPVVSLGRIAAAGGRGEEAVRRLEAAYRMGWRGYPMVDIAKDPLFEGLADDTRFQKLRQRILDDVARMRVRLHAEAGGAR